MNNKFSDFDQVKLKEDVPETPLKKGMHGTIVECREKDVYYVELFDTEFSFPLFHIDGKFLELIEK